MYEPDTQPLHAIWWLGERQIPWFSVDVSFLTGLDINKKGTEAGEKKIPESLGLAPGVVFLVRLFWDTLFPHYTLKCLRATSALLSSPDESRPGAAIYPLDSHLASM